MALHLKSTGLDFADFGSAPENSATTGNELFDDYEEGFWYTAVSLGSGNANVHSGYNKQEYSKIGNMISIRGRVHFGNGTVTSPSGAVEMTGLPFNIETQSETAHYTMVHAGILQGSGNLSSGGWLFAEISTSKVHIHDHNGNTTQNDAAAHLKNDCYLAVTGYYPTTQNGS